MKSSDKLTYMAIFFAFITSVHDSVCAEHLQDSDQPVTIFQGQDELKPSPAFEDKDMTTILPDDLSATSVLTTATDDKRGRRGDRGGRKTGESHLAKERASRGLVPQLWPNYTLPELPPANEVTCNMAYVTCAVREGCGTALKQYDMTCSDMIGGLTSVCSTSCQHALVALLSTPEGERLMECRCAVNDTLCEQTKQRVEPCRAAVTWQAGPTTRVGCTAATWICLADPQCAKALEYYNVNCRAMFKGRRCTRRCRNSLDILLRQSAASKLATCRCDGSEDFDCAAIRENTDVLCFGKTKEPTTTVGNNVDVVVDVDLNEIDVSGNRRGHGSSAASRSKSELALAVASVILTYLLPETIGGMRDILASFHGLIYGVERVVVTH